MRVLGIIPARGGSKGVPRKNLADVAGKPLIAYTIESALQASRLTDVVLSTEDEEIAGVGAKLGIEVPFLRPVELARDDTPSIDVLVHLCKWIAEQGRDYDAVCLLQPTSPQRTGEMIDSCIDRFEAGGTDSLVTVTAVPHEYNPMWVYRKKDNGELELFGGGIEPVKRRQLLPAAFIRDGRIYLTKTQAILKQHSLFGNSLTGFELEPGVNIDTPKDLEAFRQLQRNTQNNG